MINDICAVKTYRYLRKRREEVEINLMQQILKCRVNKPLNSRVDTRVALSPASEMYIYLVSCLRFICLVCLTRLPKRQFQQSRSCRRYWPTADHL